MKRKKITQQCNIREVGGIDSISLKDGKIIVTTGKLCELLWVDRSTVTRWAKQGCPQEKRGGWDLLEVLRWRGAIGDGGNRADTQALTLQEQKLQAEVALKQAQAEIAQFRSDINSGRYIERDIVENDLARFFTALKPAVLAIPKKAGASLSQHIDPVEARRLEAEFTEDVMKALEQISAGDLYASKKS